MTRVWMLMCLCFSCPDVISIEKTGEHFRLIYDVKGRFTVHRITAEEAKVNARVLFLMPGLAVALTLCVAVRTTSGPW